MSKDILWQIEDYGHYLRDMRNDGFSQFEVKKKLYEILWSTKKQLENSPTFVGEDEWINTKNSDEVFRH